jgi:protoheme IX farnesyltransferase
VSVKNYVFDLLDLLRVPATIQLSLWILLGALLGFRDIGDFLWSHLALVALGAFLGIGSGMALNDLVDRNLDKKRQNKGYDTKSRPFTKHRPLVHGVVTGLEAMFLVAVCITGVLLIVSTAPPPRNYIVMTMVAYFVVAELVYQAVRRRWPIGHPIIASIFGLWPVVGYVAVSDFHPLPLLITLFVLAFCIEVCHNQGADMVDMKDDKAMGLKTPPIKMGLKFTSYQMLLFSILATLTSLALSVVANLGVIYIGGALLADGLLVKANLEVVRQPTVDNALKAFVTNKKYVVIVFSATALDIMIGKSLPSIKLW